MDSSNLENYHCVINYARAIRLTVRNQNYVLGQFILQLLRILG